MSGNPLKRLYHYSENYRKRFLTAGFHSVTNKIFDLAPPLLIGLAVEVVVQGKIQWLNDQGLDTTMKQLLLVALLTLIVWVLESVFEYLYAIHWRNLAQDIQHRLRMDCYTHLQQMEVGYIEDKSSGALMTVVNDDVNQLERFLDGGANDVLQLLTTVIVVGSIFFITEPFIAFFAVLPMPFILFASIRFQKGLEPLYREVRDHAGLLNQELGNHLQGMATIQAFHRQEQEALKMEELSKDYVGANSQAIARSAMFVPLIRMLIMISFIATMLIGGHFVSNGTLAVGSYSVLIFLTQRLLWPLTRFGQTLDLYQRANGSLARIFSLLQEKIQIQPGEKSLKDCEGRISFQEVSFQYKDGNKVFDDLSFQIEAGQTIGFVGETGSGKSTLLKLLLRFQDSNKGEILLDGTNIRDLSFESLRKSFALVSQDVFLFHGTVQENLCFARDNVSRDELLKACDQAEALSFIQELPDGFETVIGERGQKLSGGQRQRLSIARAILADPPIMIFDEATSSVDNQTEAAIQRSLRQLTKDRTTLIVAHRLSTIVHADWIFVVGNGGIIEQGTHEDLLKQKSHYYHLWSVQTGQLPGEDSLDER